VLVHRYSGLYMAFFLIVAGLTGSILAFYHELDGWLNADRHYVAIEKLPLLDGFALREKALALEPHAQMNSIFFPKPGQVYEAIITPDLDPATGKPYELAHKSILLNPYTGNLIDYLYDEGFWPLTRHNILQFIYKLHFQLALGEIGTWLFGIAAILWTIDCFVAFYLTFPIRRKRPDLHSTDVRPRNFLSRWSVAWKIKWPASVYRLNFDLHRAGGLWTWVMLFVFAWSSVLLNLPQIYRPVMAAMVGLPASNSTPPPVLTQPRPKPLIDWSNAQSIGRSLLAGEPRLKNYTLESEELLAYQPELGVFGYYVKMHNAGNESEGVMLYFDGDNGEIVSLLHGDGQHIYYSISNWLVALHMAKIWGLPYKIFVCFMGLVITMLAVTGLYIWLKKRRARHLANNRSFVQTDADVAAE